MVARLSNVLCSPLVFAIVSCPSCIIAFAEAVLKASCSPRQWEWRFRRDERVARGDGVCQLVRAGLCCKVAGEIEDLALRKAPIRNERLLPSQPVIQVQDALL